MKRTEHNLIVRSSKSEAEVTNNRRLHSTFIIILLKLTTDGHKTFVPAEFLVLDTALINGGCWCYIRW